jgi:hypothetical protein
MLIMKRPKIGEIIYAFSNKYERIGETKFIEKTQENASKNLDDIIKELKETAKWNERKVNDYFIYEMKRIL